MPALLVLDSLEVLCPAAAAASSEAAGGGGQNVHVLANHLARILDDLRNPCRPPLPGSPPPPLAGLPCQDPPRSPGALLQIGLNLLTLSEELNDFFTNFLNWSWREDMQGCSDTVATTAPGGRCHISRGRS